MNWLIEEKESNIVFCFGRMNPPTQGHGLLIAAVKRLASKYKSDHVVYVSKTQDKKKNPLTIKQKIFYLRKAFPSINFIAANDKIRTFIEAVKDIDGKYKNLIVIAGSDRITEYKNLLDKYNGKEYNFNNIIVVSAGERDPDSDNVSGMSATKMRHAAANNDFALFSSGAPGTLPDSLVQKMFADVRSGMGISESVTIRDRYLANEIYKTGDFVLHEGKIKQIKFRGSNHLVLKCSEGNIMNTWLSEVKEFDINALLSEVLKIPVLTKTIRNNINELLIEASASKIDIDNKLLKKLKDKIDIEDNGESVDDSEKQDANLMTNTDKDNHNRIRKIHYKIHEEEKQDEIDDEINDEEIDDILDDIDDDDLLNHGYDDEDIQIVDDDGNEVEEDDLEESVESLSEVMSRVERLRLRMRFAKSKSKRVRALKLAMKRRSTPDKLAKRARKAAIKILKERLSKKKLSDMSIADKEMIEKKIAGMNKTITRIAIKLLPKLRKLETERLAHASRKEN